MPQIKQIDTHTNCSLPFQFRWSDLALAGELAGQDQAEHVNQSHFSASLQLTANGHMCIEDTLVCYKCRSNLEMTILREQHFMYRFLPASLKPVHIMQYPQFKRKFSVVLHSVSYAVRKSILPYELLVSLVFTGWIMTFNFHRQHALYSICSNECYSTERKPTFLY